MWQTYYTPTTLTQALKLLSQHAPDARIVAGGTDLVLEIERGIRRPSRLIDITRVPGLDDITVRGDGMLHLGPTVTHNQVVGSDLCARHAFPLVQACWTVGAPQIRNRGTVAGNLITASPANDTITPLWALEARIALRSYAGERHLRLDEFFEGVRRTAMHEDEVVVDICIPPMGANQRGTFVKLGLRQAQAISVVNVAVVLTFDRELHGPPDGAIVVGARIAMGSVGPTIIRAARAEAHLIGKCLDNQTMDITATLAAEDARPISDVRGSAEYRRYMTGVLVRRAVAQIAHSEEREGFPAQPIMLWGTSSGRQVVWGSREAASLGAYGAEHSQTAGQPIDTVVNGKRYQIGTGNGKTLLRLLRDDIGLTGTKEGCAEGECGACTVLLDGMAVMACLVPAPRAHGSRIVTIEGLASPGALHPIQQAFVDEGAVQCGYCTPGFIMSGMALLDEHRNPTRDEIRQALTGNVCRCTGYYSIISALERAASRQTRDEC